MVIPFDQGSLQRFHIFAAHKGFCYFQHAGNLEGSCRGRCPFRLFAVMLRFSRHLFRRAGGLFLFGLHAIRLGFLVLLDGAACSSATFFRVRVVLFSVSFFVARLRVPVFFLCSLMRKTSRNEISPRRRGSAEAGASCIRRAACGRRLHQTAGGKGVNPRAAQWQLSIQGFRGVGMRLRKRKTAASIAPSTIFFKSSSISIPAASIN